MTEAVNLDPTPEPRCVSPANRILLGLGLLLLGLAAGATPFLVKGGSWLVLGVLALAAASLEAMLAYLLPDRRRRRAALVSAVLTGGIGALLILTPKLAATGLALLLGYSFLADGLVKIAASWRGKDNLPWIETLLDGVINVLLGVAVALQWPVGATWTGGVTLGIHILMTGWAVLAARRQDPEAAPAAPEDIVLGLPPHPEVGSLRHTLAQEEATQRPYDNWWMLLFLAVFLAIHVGRMSPAWTLVGMLGPGVAALGDVAMSVIAALVVLVPIRMAWMRLTRPLERRGWRTFLAAAGNGKPESRRTRFLRWWLKGRLRFAEQLARARQSPTAAVRWALRLGLPLVAVLVATNPIWGFSWFFNTENWTAGVWEFWAQQRTDDWRAAMVQAARAGEPGLDDSSFFGVAPEGTAGSQDFSFLVIGDTGEGDASQHVLRDQLILAGLRPEVRFLVVSSDVIYPSGEMKDYEPNFYLPFKGWTKPVCAIPGNHDWYDALEGFNANFLRPEAARAAMRAQRQAERGLTTLTESRIDEDVAEADRLRRAYGVPTGSQRAPYFEVQSSRFALLAVDTGISKCIDPEQEHWLRDALRRSRGKFRFVLLGHPLYAVRRLQATEGSFAHIHQLLREEGVELVMAGDTHDFEFYREQYEHDGQPRVMDHFVNGGGGAFLSIGAALEPTEPPVDAWAHYPARQPLVDKLNTQTPAWKYPLWWWVRTLNAWPSSPEAVASAFDFNHAPFFQSFMEVRVEKSTNQVRLWLYGPNGRLRWRDVATHGLVLPGGATPDDLVEFRYPLP